MYLTIVDRKKLRTNNAIIHCPLLAAIESNVHAYGHWYLAFGVMSGGVCSVSLAHLLQSGLADFLNPPKHKLATIVDDIFAASSIAKHYKKGLAMPMMAALLAIRQRSPKSWHTDGCIVRDQILGSLGEDNVPKAWVHDASIMTDVASFSGFADAKRFMYLLRGLVQRKHGQDASSLLNDADKELLDVTWLSMMADDRVHLSAIYFFAALGGGVCMPEDEDDGSYVDEAASFSNINVDGDAVPRRPKPLPPGIMDHDTKREVEQARSFTPRYLFRAWNNTDSFSGGFKGLNTQQAITPLAYARDQEAPGRRELRSGWTGYGSIYSMTRDQLINMALRHLRTDRSRNFETQFSSWAASLLVAIGFGKERGPPENVYISIIDTKMLSKRNVILHVPALKPLSGVFDAWHHEYLAHGVIQGAAHKAVPLTAFHGFDIPSKWSKMFPANPRALFPSIKLEDVLHARKVAELYGGRFVMAVTVALLCVQQRHYNFWQDAEIDDLAAVVDGLAGCLPSKHWCSDATILTDTVYTIGYGPVAQMTRMLRALVDYYHGRGARSRSRSRSRIRTAVRTKQCKGGSRALKLRFANGVGRPLEEVRVFDETEPANKVGKAEEGEMEQEANVDERGRGRPRQRSTMRRQDY